MERRLVADEEALETTKNPHFQIGGRDTVLGVAGAPLTAYAAAIPVPARVGHHASAADIAEIPDEEWDVTFRINIHARLYLAKAAVPHMKPGSAIINTTSVNADKPSPQLLAYATTKGAIHNSTMGLAQMLAEKGIRVNCVAPGPVWTPLIPSTMPVEKVTTFGQQSPKKRPAQPAELASTYVMLAEPRSSYTTGAKVAVTGGTPFM